MKKAILFSACLCFLAGGLFAQESKVENVLNSNRFGLYLGIGSSWLNPKSGTSDEYNVTKGSGKTAFSFGLAAEKAISDRYSFNYGIGVDWEGGNIIASIPSTATNNDTSTYAQKMDVAYSLQYVRVPLGLKLKAANIANMRIFGLIGADVGILISKKEQIDGEYYNSPTDSMTTVISLQDSKESVTVPINVGYQVGVGLEYDITDDNAVFVQLLYRNGLIDITSPKTNKDHYKFKDGNVASNTIGLRIGYFF